MTRACASTVVRSQPATYKSRVSSPASGFTGKECERLGIRRETRWRLLAFISNGWTLVLWLRQTTSAHRLVLPGRRSMGEPVRWSVDVVKENMKLIHWWLLRGSWWGWEGDAEDTVTRRQVIGCVEAMRRTAKMRFSDLLLIWFSQLHCLVVMKNDFSDFYD